MLAQNKEYDNINIYNSNRLHPESLYYISKRKGINPSYDVSNFLFSFHSFVLPLFLSFFLSCSTSFYGDTSY